MEVSSTRRGHTKSNGRVEKEQASQGRDGKASQLRCKDEKIPRQKEGISILVRRHRYQRLIGGKNRALDGGSELPERRCSRAPGAGLQRALDPAFVSPNIFERLLLHSLESVKCRMDKIRFEFRKTSPASVQRMDGRGHAWSPFRALLSKHRDTKAQPRSCCMCSLGLKFSHSISHN